MAITKKGLGWELMQSWHFLLTLVPLGITGWLAFLYQSLRSKKIKWFLAAVVYLAFVAGFFYLSDLHPDGATRSSNIDNAIFGLVVAAWVIPIIHALISRKEYLLILEARGTASEQKGDLLRAEIQSKYKVSDNKIDDTLVQYKEDDLSVKVCRLICNTFPFSPDFEYYFNVEGAVKRLDASASAQTIARAKELAKGDDMIRAVKVASAVDIADGGLGVFTGIKNAYDHIKKKEGIRTFEADPQQAADAGIKAMTIAYLIGDLFPGSIPEKVQRFFETRAGQELAVYFAGAEIALPFTDNLLEGAGNWINQLLNQQGDAAEKKFAEFAGQGSISEVRQILQTFGETMDRTLVQVKGYLDPFMERVQGSLPGIMNAADSVTGGAATALDMLPIWKLLGSRVAAEACALRAIRGWDS